MKRKLLIAGALFIFANTIQAQDGEKAFEEGKVAIEAGVGFAGYATLLHTELKVGNATLKSDQKDHATSLICPIVAEYGIRNWFGLGGRFAYSNYYQDKDSITHRQPTNRGLDLDILLNFHWIKTKRFEMPISLFIGYSHIKINYNDVAGTVAKDNGLNNGFMLTPKFYFNDNIGIYINLGFVNYGYPHLQLSNNAKGNLNGDNWLVQLGGRGTTMGIGIAVKI